LTKPLQLRGIDDIDNRKPISFIGLDLSRQCNLGCRYCYEDAGKASPNELTLNEKRMVIDQAASLGARSMLVPGAGEPLLDHDFQAVVQHARNRGLVSVIYTNGVLIDQKTATFMFDHDVTPLIKIESLNAETHDWLTCIDGTHEKALQGIVNLLEAGYESWHQCNGRLTRIGTATLYLKQNLHELQAIQYFFKEKGVKSTFDVLSISGRACRWEEKIKPRFCEIAEMATLLGAEESVCPENEPCRLWQYGIMVGNTGDISFCTATHPQIGNVRDYDLKSLLERKEQLYPIQIGKLTCPVKEVDYAL